MALQAILFDLYGTLVDILTDEGDPEVYRVLSQFLTYYDIFYPPEELAARYREKAAAKMAEHPGPYGEIDVGQVFEEILTEGWGKQPERSLVLWVARLFRSLTRRRFGLFPDTLPALTELSRDFQLGLVSDAQWIYSEPEIRLLGLHRFFDPIILSSRFFVRKPDPQIFQHALRSLRISAPEALYVGNDPAEDLRGPQAIGLPVLLVDRAGGLTPGSFPLIRSLLDLPLLIQDAYNKP
jgi:putative hydrolase of the HAD superfamily